MSRLPLLLIVALVATTLVGETDQKVEVEALFSRLMAADNAGDLEGVMACYARDAVLMPPGAQPVKGLENIRPRYASLFDSSRLEVSMDSVELEIQGSLAFSRGTTRGRVIPKDGSAPRPLHDSYLMILRKTEGEGWRIAVLMWSATSPN